MPPISWPRAGDLRQAGPYRLTGPVAGQPGASSGSAGRYHGQAPDGTEVIVTLLSPAGPHDPAAAERLAATALAAQQIAPFCVARILDASAEAGDEYLVTEYVPGPTLAGVVAAEGAQAGPVLMALAAGTVTGLAAIHQAGLAHGEFGPGQVLLSPDGPKITPAGLTSGPGASAADMQAWAETVLFCALGRPPVGPQDLAGVGGELGSAVAACLAPDPAGRPAARAVLAQLLGRQDLSAPLLAGGAELARAAARGPATRPGTGPGGAPGTGSDRRGRAGTHAGRAGRTRPLLWGTATAVCLLGLAAGVAAIVRQQTASPAGPAPVPPAVLAGSWSGPVHQTHPALSVTVLISLPAGLAAGTIAYPSLHCSGSLAIIAAAPGRLTLHQTIRAGRRTCRDGDITLAAGPAGTATFRFHRTGDGRTAGTLARQAS
jgi:eukaryotic-like serine/threonine-protein kinase